MKLIATMPIRNESWCVGLSLRVALLWVDEIVILLHECTDDSGDIVEQVIRENERGRIHVLRASGEWTEMQHRQAMLLEARECGATHIAIVDADEVLTGNMVGLTSSPRTVRGATNHGPRIWDDMSAVCVGRILQLPLYNLRGSIDRYHANGIWGIKHTCLAFRDDPRLSWSGDQFHHRHPGGVNFTPYTPVQWGQGGIMHLWGVSERRLRSKHALYKITERLRWPAKPSSEIDRTYSWAIKGDPQNPRWGTPETWTYSPVPEEWWKPYRQWLKYLYIDLEPWQEREVQRLVAKHGRETFAGLDLFEVV